MISIGIDLGGTNLRAASYLDAPALAGEPIAMHREPVGCARSPNEMLERIALLIPSLLPEHAREQEGEPVRVGLAVAAMLRGFTGHVSNAPQFGWRDVPFGTMLAERLGPRYQLQLYNDLNAISYGEYRFGAAAELATNDLFVVCIGTGIGAGAICGGRLLYGADNTAMELGHVKVASGPAARACACGSRGCIEAYAGGKQLQDRARGELAAGGARSLATELAGSVSAITPGHLDAAVAAGDDYACGLYAEIVPLLGLAVGNGITLLNPGCLILGGGMLSRTPVLRGKLVEELAEVVNASTLAGVQVVQASLGDRAGLLGAAMLAMECC